LQVIAEETNEWCIEVFDPDLGGRFAEPFFGKLQKQTEAVAISGNGKRARLSLAKQAIGEKRLKKRRKAGGNQEAGTWLSRNRRSSAANPTAAAAYSSHCQGSSAAHPQISCARGWRECEPTSLPPAYLP